MEFYGVIGSWKKTMYWNLSNLQLFLIFIFTVRIVFHYILDKVEVYLNHHLIQLFARIVCKYILPFRVFHQ